MTCTAISHNTIAWDVRRGGAKDPGKDQPGNWYHDNQQPYVDLGGLTPSLHYEIGWDKDSEPITAIRGKVTQAGECAGAALLEGKVTIKALSETPTRASNYEIAIASQAWPPMKKLDKPFTWTRRLLSVYAPTAEGMNYLVVRDDFGGWDGRTPSFNYWALADGVELAGDKAFFKGALGVDTDLSVIAPSKVTLHKDSFTNTECEGAVGGRHQAKYGKAFSETYQLCRVEGQKGQGFFVTLFPRKADEPKPVVESWQGGKGVKITWKNETHYVLLDTQSHEIDADGIQAKATALVVKVTDEKNYSVSLPAGGEARFRGRKLKADGPVEVSVTNGKAVQTTGANLIPPAK
jgi:hypothetical protein